MARILLIEDQADVRSFVKIVLERAGHQVREAANGADGISAIRETLPDLIVTDIFMPVNDGLEVIRETRKLSPDLPIVAISGGTPKIARTYLPVAETFGATETLEKPFTPTDLLEVVRHALLGAS
jgi:CheY-like chemotaxis protein